MLSKQEYENSLWQIKNIPSHLPADHRNNIRQCLRKKIKEHELCTTHRLFEPLVHDAQFLNRTTSQENLIKLIEAAKSVNEFTLDTESINVYKQKNKPATIQIQMLLKNNQPSIVFILEACHLPKEHERGFDLIKQLFKIIFSEEKRIFIWGSKNELNQFVICNLFTTNQIEKLYVINLQDNFKRFWTIQHPHRSSSSTTINLNNDCICERCLGYEHNHLWALQDAVARQLNEYLPKILTNQGFSMGLDPKLFHMNSNEQIHRQELAKYARNDCLAMEKIIIQMKQIKFEFSRELLKIKFKNNSFKNKLFKFSSSLLDDSDDDDDDDIIYTKNTPSITIPKNIIQSSTHQETPVSHPPVPVPSIIDSHRYPIHWESNRTNDNDGTAPDWSTDELILHVNDDERLELEEQPVQSSAEERHKLHNKACTKKQRKRYYRNELIFEQFDPRFKKRQIKMILKRENIPIYIVNSDTKTKIKKLFVAIREPSKIIQYQEQTKGFFTKKHYNELKRNGQLPLVPSLRQEPASTAQTKH